MIGVPWRYVRIAKAELRGNDLRLVLTIDSDLGGAPGTESDREPPEQSFGAVPAEYTAAHPSTPQQGPLTWAIGDGTLTPLQCREIAPNGYYEAVCSCLPRAGRFVLHVYQATPGARSGIELTSTQPATILGQSAEIEVLKKTKMRIVHRYRRFFGPNSALVCIDEPSEAIIGGHVWDAGVAVARDISASVNGVCAKHIIGRNCVVELGSGTGLAGVIVARSFPRLNVILTDRDDEPELPIERVSRALSNVTAARWTWGADMPDAVRRHAPLPDVALCTDGIYNEDAHAALHKSICDIASARGPDDYPLLLIMAHKRRGGREASFFDHPDTKYWHDWTRIALHGCILLDIAKVIVQ